MPEDRRMVAQGQEVTLRMRVEYPSPWELEVRGEIVATGTHVLALYEILRMGVDVEEEAKHPVAAREMRLLLESFEATISPRLRGLAGSNGSMN